MTKNLFLLAGEKSGDLLGGNLLKAIKAHFPAHRLSGIGGPKMRKAGLECLMRTEDFEIMGFSDILKSMPKLFHQFKKVRNHILESKPDAAIFIDYPGFNLRMAKSLRDHGYKGKLVQYVSPTVWAWGKKRIDHMAKSLDLLMTIYPFENACFNESPLNVRYVGNPIKEIISRHNYEDHWAKIFGIKDTANLVAIFPGSRRSEIQLNLPFQLKAAELLKSEFPNACFGISCAHEKIMPLMHEILSVNSLKLNKDIFLLPKAYSYELMRDCRSALAKSGTVTLELALHQCPTTVMYKLTKLNRFIAQYLMRLNLPHYCIVNILSGKTVYPEIIERGLTPQNLYEKIRLLHADTEERAQCIEDCKRLSALLDEKQPSQMAALAIKELIG